MRLLPRSCPLCGSSDNSVVVAENNVDESALDGFAFSSRKKPELMHFRMVLCPSCDLQYACEVPEEGWLGRQYEEAQFDAAEESRHAARTYMYYINQHLGARATSQGKSLDIGAGDGAFVAELVRAGFEEAVGVEPSKAPYERAYPEVKARLINEFFNPEDFGEDSIDLVSCFQTLEHITDPLGVLRSVYKILRKGGLFCVADHNHRALSARILGLKSPIYDIEHLQLFSPKSLGRIFEEAGFGDIRVFPISNRYPVRYWARLMPGILGSALRAVAEAMGLSSVIVPLRAGNLMALGRKV